MPVVQGDVPALRRQFQRDGAAEAAAGARDEGGFDWRGSGGWVHGWLNARYAQSCIKGKGGQGGSCCINCQGRALVATMTGCPCPNPIPTRSPHPTPFCNWSPTTSRGPAAPFPSPVSWNWPCTRPAWAITAAVRPSWAKQAILQRRPN